MKTINVTEEHINNGEPGDDEYCPIALAVRDEFGLNFTDDVIVCDSIRIIRDGEEVCDVPLPRSALDFIDEFDAGEDVYPFSFTVEL